MLLPAIISYIALFYISHLEALKLGLKGMDDTDVPHLKKTFLSGLHFLIPIFVLIFLLVYMRYTAGFSIFYATLSFATVSTTKIRLVPRPVEATAPTIIPAVAIATPTLTILRAPFSSPVTVSLYQILIK